MQEDLNTETLHKQFLITQKETNTSHVMEYGDKVSYIGSSRQHFLCLKLILFSYPSI